MLLRALPLALLGFSSLVSRAAELPNPWRQEVLFQLPKTYPANSPLEPGVEALFYDGLPYEGKPTRVFAYLGIPAHAPGAQVPAMVLVHGGGGTAFADWVRLWTARGYAAIAMDTAGTMPGPDPKDRIRHELGGPPGWGGFQQASKPPEDQWTYHAVADVLLAHSLLRARPEVDASRIGLTGISWGGYLTCIVASVDDRFRFASPVYGCGFLADNSAWLKQFAARGPDATKLWLSRWDPSVYLPHAKLPMLWVDGTNDTAYPIDSLQKSYRLPPGPRSLCIRVRMPHTHPAGETAEEIHAFANHFLKGGQALPKLSATMLTDGVLRANYESPDRPAKVELNFTHESGAWQKRRWETVPANFWSDPRQVWAALPKGATAAYFNVIDDKGLAVSSDYVELPEP
jgi:dienelactone hydrolase